MDSITRQRLEHYQDIDEKYSLALSRSGKQVQESFLRKQHDIDRLLALENLRAQGPHHAVAAFGLGYAGFGNGWTDARPRILYPKERKRPRRHLREIYFPRDVLRRIATVDEVLVPMRIDIDFDKYKLRDVLTWNLLDDTLSLEVFAEHLCEDYGLPPSGFVNEITKSLRAQLAEHHPHRFPEEARSDSTGSCEHGKLSYTETKDDDLRVCIKLDITVGTLNLVDQIEWDLNNAENDPEYYAAGFCDEVGLSKEFETAIAHAIREQCQLYTKSLFLAGHTFDGKGVQDSDLRQALMPPIYSSSRPRHHMDQFAPMISDLVPDQIEKIERDREREGRRNRRQTRGKRGVILPDLHDLPKTYRSPYVNTVLVPDSEQFPDMARRALLTNKLYNESDHVSDDERWQDAESPRQERGLRTSRTLRPTSNTLMNDAANHTRYVSDPHHRTWTTSPRPVSQHNDQALLDQQNSVVQKRLPITNSNIPSPHVGRNSKAPTNMLLWDSEVQLNGASHVDSRFERAVYRPIHELKMSRKSSLSPPSLVVTLRIPRTRLSELVEPASLGDGPKPKGFASVDVQNKQEKLSTS